MAWICSLGAAGRCSGHHGSVRSAEDQALIPKDSVDMRGFGLLATVCCLVLLLDKLPVH